MILIVAATGKTGRAVTRALSAKGVGVRALARSPRIHELAADGVDTVTGDILNPDTLRAALDGVEAVVHVGPAFDPLEVAMGQSVVDAAVAAGVRRLVQFSVIHPVIDFLVNHQAKRRIEDYVINSGLDYTILQPTHYMQNVDPARVADAGVFTLPYSVQTPLAFVDMEDVAQVAAKVLTESGHVHASYPLCGTDRLSGAQIAAAIAARAGTAVGTREISVSDFLERRAVAAGGRLPRYTVDGYYRLFTYYGLHGITGNPNVLRWLLGREPTSFAAYVDRCLVASAESAHA